MRTAHDSPQNRLHATLGFFMQGLPVIFVRTETVFAIDPYLSRYLKAAMGGGMPDFTEDALLKGFEQFITSSHELRHFHDALLSRPLFRLFMLQNSRFWRVLQLPGNISGLTAADLPLQNGKAIQADVTPFGLSLIGEVQEADRLYNMERRRLYKTHTCKNDLTVSMVDLLEADAIAAELLYILVSHNAASAEQYYRQVVCQLPIEYNKLVNVFVDHAGSFDQAIVSLHLAVAHSLYGSDDPASSFCKVIEDYLARPDGFVDRYGPQAIGELFGGEPALEEWVMSHRVVGMDALAERPVQAPNELLEEMLGFHRNIYAARKLLIETYIKNFEMNAFDYYQRTDELPLPPIVFWPGEISEAGQGINVREDMLQQFGLDMYMIRGGDWERGDLRVVAGIGPYGLRKPFLDYRLVDLHMLAYYWYRRLFTETDSEVYSPLVDEMYEALLRESFGLS